MCLVGLPRDLTDVCSHCRRYSGRSVTLITHLLMVPMLAMPGSGTPNPICLLFMSWAQLYTGTVSTKIFFWNVRSFRLVDTSKCFERICCLHPQNIYIYVYIYIYTPIPADMLLLYSYIYFCEILIFQVLFDLLLKDPKNILSFLSCPCEHCFCN